MADLPLHPTTTSRDTISVTNLQLPFGVIAPDVWGQAKEQPALVSLELQLQGAGFGSAADGDKLDDSTIHYGNLAKKIRKSCFENQTAGDLSHNIEEAIQALGMKSENKFIVARSTAEVHLPKASMYGDGGVTLITATTYDQTGKITGLSRIFGVRKIKIMTLVGVNAYERSQKQPLVTSILLHLRSEVQTTDSGQTVALFNLEQTLVQIIQDTSFETLETLADFTIVQLRKKMLDKVLPGTRVQLRIEKPRAIAWADAPAVEVLRDVPVSKRSTTILSGSSRPSTSLSKPQDNKRPVSAMPEIPSITETQHPRPATTFTEIKRPTSNHELRRSKIDEEDQPGLPTTSVLQQRSNSVTGTTPRLSILKPYV